MFYNVALMVECEKIGLNHAVNLSYAAIDRAHAAVSEKRSLLHSLYAFRCLFDNAEFSYVNPILKKYGCIFSMPLSHHPEYNLHKDEFKKIAEEKPLYIPFGGLYSEELGEFKLRFDAGSELYFRFVSAGKITGDAAIMPEKFSLYELIYRLITLSSADDNLRAAWYLIFPYIVMIGAPHEEVYYSKIRKILVSEPVFKKVILSDYSTNTADSAEELMSQGMPNIIIDFCLPYIEWKNERDSKGDSREVIRFRRWLAKGRFTEVLAGTEKLLDTFPDDDNLLITNIAARISLEGAIEPSERELLLKDTVNVLDAVLERPGDKKIYFLYYYGVALLGLKQIDAALDKFVECLEINPDFEPALLMQKAIKEKLPQ